MDIQATKLELMQLLLNTKKKEVLERLKEVFEQEEFDFWNDLNSEDKAAINEGLEQLNSGEHVAHESVKTEINKRFNF